jgi:hypothetical protein
VRPTNEKLSRETARPDARYRRSRADATGRRVVETHNKVDEVSVWPQNDVTAAHGVAEVEPVQLQDE